MISTTQLELPIINYIKLEKKLSKNSKIIVFKKTDDGKITIFNIHHDESVLIQEIDIHSSDELIVDINKEVQCDLSHIFRNYGYDIDYLSFKTNMVYVSNEDYVMNSNILSFVINKFNNGECEVAILMLNKNLYFCNDKLKYIKYMQPNDELKSAIFTRSFDINTLSKKVVTSKISKTLFMQFIKENPNLTENDKEEILNSVEKFYNNEKLKQDIKNELMNSFSAETEKTIKSLLIVKQMKVETVEIEIDRLKSKLDDYKKERSKIQKQFNDKLKCEIKKLKEEGFNEKDINRFISLLKKDIKKK